MHPLESIATIMAQLFGGLFDRLIAEDPFLVADTATTSQAMGLVAAGVIALLIGFALRQLLPKLLATLASLPFNVVAAFLCCSGFVRLFVEDWDNVGVIGGIGGLIVTLLGLKKLFGM